MGGATNYVWAVLEDGDTSWLVGGTGVRQLLMTAVDFAGVGASGDGLWFILGAWYVVCRVFFRGVLSWVSQVTWLVLGPLQIGDARYS